MPSPRPPYLHRATTRHGKTVWYVRKGQIGRIRLRQPYGTPDFWEEYQAAIAGQVASKPTPGAPSGSLQWLYDRYRESAKWASLSVATRRQRENILAHVMTAIGHEPYLKVTKRSIEAAIDRRRHTPAQARNFLDAMRGLYRWALRNDHVRIDPTAGVKAPERTAGPGFTAWSMEDVAKFEAYWPAGSRQRVWLHVLLYTGLRRGDAVRFGRQHVKDGIATIKTEKSQMQVEAVFAMVPDLVDTLEQGPTGDLTFICGADGRPLVKESFGNMFSKACRDAGLTRSAHGLRKLQATIWAERGATEREMEAMFGWEGGAMARHYTKKADRKRLAEGAASRLLGTPEEQRRAHLDRQGVRTLKKAE
ncbi:MAG: tyrosine-type recombinase/integrase [Rhizomicrobium sp.]